MGEGPGVAVVAVAGALGRRSSGSLRGYLGPATCSPGAPLEGMYGGGRERAEVYALRILPCVVSSRSAPVRWW